MIALVAGGAWLSVGLKLLRDEARQGHAEKAEPAEAERARPSPSEIEVRAFRRVLEALEELRVSMGVGEVPAIWLEGRYLSAASAFPEVGAFWSRYLSWLEEAGERESELFRKAYLEEMDRRRVEGPLRTLRLASAQRSFRAWQAERVSVYQRSRHLALSALVLHDLLLELEGRITHEPAAGAALSRAPVIEASGTDAASQRRLEDALDEVLRALVSAEGTVTSSRREIPSGVVRRMRETVPEEEGSG